MLATWQPCLASNPHLGTECNPHTYAEHTHTCVHAALPSHSPRHTRVQTLSHSGVHSHTGTHKLSWPISSAVAQFVATCSQVIIDSWLRKKSRPQRTPHCLLCKRHLKCTRLPGELNSPPLHTHTRSLTHTETHRVQAHRATQSHLHSRLRPPSHPQSPEV